MPTTDKKRRNPARKTAAAAKPARLVNDASIAELAYSRWQSRGCPVSDGREDWFAARAELLQEKTLR